MFQIGDMAYMIESCRTIRSGVIVRGKDGMYLLRFAEGGGVWLRWDRLFHTEKEAEAAIPHRDSYRSTMKGMAAFRNHLDAVWG